MKETGHENKARLRTLLTLVLVSAWTPLMPQSGTCSDSDKTAATKEASSRGESLEQKRPQSQKVPGMKIYIDPKTGNFSDPSSQQLPTEAQKSLDASRESSPPELRQAPSPRPGGGVMIDLRGRFHSPLTATRKPDGKLSIEHRSPAVPSDKQ
jgi:hypothetical protein